MARDVIPYRRLRLKSSTIRSSMLVKSYENEELRREIAGHDSEREAEKLEEMAAAEDYRYWADRKEESIRTTMAVSVMMTNHTRRTPSGLLLIKMAGEHLEESQRLYYLSVDWLNLNMHGLNHLETRCRSLGRL